ncbi:hypothetical protein OF001_U20234 [Pseudomonas sp. OF001]|uniref:hypothetical protein n=1 Tax=Pseudomonas sp. OF001 TaxID=2772300 RepID=UPI001919B8EC|nr:hypothetical protein [Pseudomonas sp. OF001]CAD5377307.1 hypothetical protein OF001_U20234 [Pseudomonas sp. OF001]
MRRTNLDMQAIASRVSTAFSTLRFSKGDLKMMGHLLEPLREELSTRTAYGRRRYPMYLVGYAQGLTDAEYRRIMQYEVEFVYRHPETKVIYSTHYGSSHRSTEEFYDRQAGSELNDYEAAHVWKGTDKAFNGWEPVWRKRETLEDAA